MDTETVGVAGDCLPPKIDHVRTLELRYIELLEKRIAELEALAQKPASVGMAVREIVLFLRSWNTISAKNMSRTHTEKSTKMERKMMGRTAQEVKRKRTWRNR